MQNPFAVAVQWPDEPRRYLVHLHRPYFTASIIETVSAAWLLVSWAPGTLCDDAQRLSLFRAAADFCLTQLDQVHVPIEFVERRDGHHLPRYVMAQTAAHSLFIVEPDHSAPLVEVRDSDAETRGASKPKLSQRFDVITQWRLGEMRNYYQQFLQRQQSVAGVQLNSCVVASHKK